MMSRKLIVGERIMYVDAQTPLNGVFAVKIQGAFTMDRLSAALHKIQQKHYLLRASIRPGKNGALCFVSNEQIKAIPVRVVERSGDDDWMAQSKLEWGQLFDEENAPMARVVWIKGDEASDLLLVCPHCISDGTAFVSLMSDLLLLLDHPEKELAGYAPFNSIQELVSASFKATFKQIFKARLFAGVAKLFFLLKATGKKSAAGDSYMLHWKLDAQATNWLLAACKAHDVTVHAAICVAYMEAFQHVKGAQANGEVISPVDIRRFIKEIGYDHLFAFAPIVKLNIDKNGQQDFWLKAKKLKDDLNSKIAEMKVYELLVMSEYFHSSANGMVKFLKSTNGSHDVTLSNMGRLGIPEQYDSFAVAAVYSPTVGFTWKNPTTAVVSTFKGEMDFTFYSNHTFLSQQEADAIKESVLQLLKEPAVSYA